ncbi:hypothetical protein FACS189454_09200 [Planctomycetales bacterium]|nr:hypothetical protein FACS189454_09200 [Planctomycetales bacterium]
MWARKQIPINLLTHFNPHIAAKQIAKKHGKQTDLARIILQSVSGNDEEFCNLFYHGIQTGTLKLNHTSFFFVPRAVLDTSLFWRHINECAAYFHTPISFDADLDYVCGESARNSEYAPDEEKRRRKNCIKLQIARTENDLAGMSELANSDKTWQTPSFCLQFYTQHQRMPKWEDVVLWNEDERNTPWANLKNDEAD